MIYCNKFEKPVNGIGTNNCKEYKFIHADKKDCLKYDEHECFFCEYSYTNPR